MHRFEKLNETQRVHTSARIESLHCRCYDIAELRRQYKSYYNIIIETQREIWGGCEFRTQIRPYLYLSMPFEGIYYIRRPWTRTLPRDKDIDPFKL